MRVIDHTRRHRAQQTKKSAKKPIVFAVLTLVIIFGAVALMTQSSDYDQTQRVQTASAANQAVAPAPKTGKLKQFSGTQFKDLYNSFTYPNTKRISQDTDITGNVEADKRIRAVAESRGYQIRSAPVSDTFVNVGENYELQQRAAQPWLDMVAAAKKDSLDLNLTAAYRSAEDQKLLFLNRINQLGLSPDIIAAGANDAQISQILRTTTIPGYSRHHTGYSVDIGCGAQPDSAFKFTECFDWLSANNYERAKTYGWIPSYPEGTTLQGPDPEAWEYVWVGRDAVTE